MKMRPGNKRRSLRRLAFSQISANGTGPRCAVLYHCKCHEATSVDDRVAASASCAGEFCHCSCHRGEMPAIVHPEDVLDFMLSF